MSRVVGLGHVGIYCWDLKKMTDFYQNFMGMQLTKQNWQRGMIFLSTDPDRSDHEIALMAGRPEGEQPHLIDQISMRVETLDDLRDFVRRIKEAGLRIDHIVSHCSAIGCYFFDPEGNRTEVFWLTGRPCWVPALQPVDVENLTDDQIMAIVDEQWARMRHVRPGEVLEPAMAVPV
ncbi:MAG TPA: VOC family protein [Chloroflexota bacterium]|jgi:catechol-2,3-dioxygenase